MSKFFSFFFVLVIINNSFAQKDKELFRINNSPVMVSEFKQVYEKNLGIIVDKESKNIDSYLKLYINYKLKVKEAYILKLDTLKSYKRELEVYKNQLIAPYLLDEAFLSKLIKDAYYRKINEVKASHILIKFPKNGIKFDTLMLYKRIEEVRNRILNGESFEEVAKEVSEDPSAKINGGDLGYFSVFSMLYPFEEAAYKTPLNQVSKPFKTKYGYHILKVTGKRLSKGSFDVAHILVKNSSNSKEKIDSLYKKLKFGSSFNVVAKKYSEDNATAFLGGNLPRFGTGDMVSVFENKVLEIKKLGDYTKPFKTKFGWHIVKLIKNHPLGSFDELKEELTKKVRNSSRATLSKQVVLSRLKKEYKIKESEKALAVFLVSENDEINQDNLNSVLLTINKKKIFVKSFYYYRKKNKSLPIKTVYEDFINYEVLTYFKNDLLHTKPEFKQAFLEYKEGLLLFELLQEKIWNTSLNDTIGLKAFYKLNKSKYKNKSFTEVRGYVITDYQKQLEADWVKELREKNKIEIKEKELQKFKKIYNQ
ncbi:peptidylprolyl isomerase [Tenacibaculum sp. AHE15PA]|uniref:peptidylprolyl isomerase n=1 Tax=unclassified Tenacibaculum TaxID=2635139 RepID=UPI001C4F40C9|nr:MULTISPECIES: peptidylprolyl isomerase [unclassified Tenacibaculum]QXP74007.1 peptidylprolyl isomerase [Tenacibaculum sp. AHE14PA]QXP75625.1 peptidylprolyl isomerase [Tenacibaculum sp. AHE15PA]